MIDNSTLERIYELNREYKFIWGKEVDYTITPNGLTQEKLVKCLELMIQTNDSLLVAYNKLFNKQS